MNIFMTGILKKSFLKPVRTAGLRWTRIEVILLNDSQHFVTLIGYLTIIFIIIGVLILLVELVKFGLENLKRIYKYKHRFDKKPTAKCYCIDCKYHDNFIGSCFGFDRHHNTADNWFCWKASPRKDEILNNSVNEEEHNG